MAFASDSTTAPAPHRALLLRVCASVTDGIGRTLDRMAEGRAKPARDARGRFCRRSDLAVLSPADDADLDAAVRALFAGIDAGRAEPLLSAGVVPSEETPAGVLPIGSMGVPSSGQTSATAPNFGDTSDAIHADLDALIAEATLLPPPAPLPSLTAALSRRRSIFGAVAVDEPDTAAEARAIHLRRQLEAAAEHGAAMLAALGLPRLVYPDFVGVDPMTAGDALDHAIAALDAMDGDPDLEDGADDEFTGDDELSLGWTAKVDQVHLGYDQDDHEVTALERHGLGFFRSGPDDAEDDDPAEHDFRSHGPASTLRPLVAHA